MYYKYHKNTFTKRFRLRLLAGEILKYAYMMAKYTHNILTTQASTREI